MVEKKKKYQSLFRQINKKTDALYNQFYGLELVVQDTQNKVEQLMIELGKLEREFNAK